MHGTFEEVDKQCLQVVAGDCRHLAHCDAPSGSRPGGLCVCLHMCVGIHVCVCVCAFVRVPMLPLAFGTHPVG